MPAGWTVPEERLADAGLLLLQSGPFIGDFLPLWFTKESYLEYAAQMMDAGYMATMEGLLTWPVFGVIVLSILVGSVLGSLLGMKLMRKHFVKAGLAQ